MTLPFGLDLSQWQSRAKDGKFMDMDKLVGHDDPVRFVFIRASLGVYTDPAFSFYDKELERLGIPYGGYHYALPSYSARLQVEHFLKVAPVKAGRRWVLDLETTQGLSRDRLTDFTLEFIELMKEKTGRYPMLYSRASWINPNLEVARLPVLDYWLAQYLRQKPHPAYTEEFPSNKIDLPKGVKQEWVKFHQTGDKADGSKYGALSYYIDTNRFFGKETELLQWFGVVEKGAENTFITYLPMIANQNEPPKDERKWLFEAKVVTTYDYLPVRVAPNTAAKMVGKCYFGDIVKVYEADKDLWYRVGDNEWVWGRRCKSLQEPLKTLAYPIAREFPVSQVFGINSGTYGAAKGHNGVDYACWVGSALVAAADGFVETWEPYTQYGYGRHVRIRVRGGVLIYGHMKEIFVKKGEKVKKGQVIGTSDGEKGNPYAGFSTGAHLHFEYRIDREPIPLRPGNHTYWAIDTLPITDKPLQ